MVGVMGDKINIEIMEDGQIKITTDAISQANHCSADELLDEITKMLGGERVTKKTRHGHSHVVAGKKVWHKH